MKKKILIDSISLLSPSTGIGRYTYEICNLIKNEGKFDNTFYYGYYSKKLLVPEKQTNSKFVKSIISKNENLKKIVRWLAFKSAKLIPRKFDLYFQPNFIVNENIKATKIVTAVHDFSCIKYKEFHPKERIDYFEKFFLKNINKSDHIICFSEFTKNEIVEILNYPKEKISVLYHGIQKNIFYKKENITSNIKLPKKFILSVGSIEPRKNLITLLNAYDKLNDVIKNEYKLVLVGFKGWENKEIMNLIKKNKIIYLGYISDDELSNVYNLATCFIFPSLYEGFGLPPIEAMACGTPVIASNISCIPEICGEAAIYFNPFDVEELSNMMTNLLNNIDLQNKLALLGIERASKYNWNNSAEKHIEIFNSLLDENKGINNE
jgi:glycosyltransferase involved in cell wall biosynthesis